MARKKPTYFYAILSVALVLYILGFFGLMTLHGRKVVTLFKEKIDLWVELQPGIGQEDITRIVAEINAQPFVKESSVRFITRDQAAATMKEDLGEESLLEDAPDLLRDVIRFNVQADYLNNEVMLQWKESLKQDSLVADLYFEAANTANVGQNIQSLGLIALGIGLLLVFAAVTLIHNTIRLALYSNRFVVKNQELVGASWTFISRPYIRQGIVNGIWSAALASTALMATIWWLYHVMPDLRQLQDTNGVIVVILLIFLVGIIISGLSTWFVVNKFLKMRIDDLY